MAAVGLRETILERHAHQPTHATYNRNSKGKPIDGIFATAGVQIQAGGNYGFGETVPSTHRALWVDVSIQDLLGNSSRERPSSFQTRRLKIDDPCMVRRYVASVEAEYRRFPITQQLLKLLQDVNQQDGRISVGQTRQFEWLHQKSYEIRRQAEGSCRKLRRGKTDWSPSLQKIWDRMEVFCLLSQLGTGCLISSRRMHRFMKKADLPDAWQLSLDGIQEARTSIRRKYRAWERKAPELRDSFLDGLARALANETNTTATPEKKQRLTPMRQKEAQ
jgi:hypothetical protein